MLLTRLSLGSLPAPFEFCVTAKMTFNLSGDLLYCKQWDLASLSSSYTSQLPASTYLPNEIEFGEAAEADVKPDPSTLRSTDGYIDGGACTVLDTTWNWKIVQRVVQTLVMALFLVFFPLSLLLEPVRHPDPTSIGKMLAESGLCETIMFLG